MAHLTCADHGKRVFCAVTKNGEFIVRHRNVGDGSELVCDGDTFRIANELYERHQLVIMV